MLDEADWLLNEDFEKSLDEILNVIPRERKTYLFSATMTKKVKKLQRACLRNPVNVVWLLPHYFRCSVGVDNLILFAFVFR